MKILIVTELAPVELIRAIQEKLGVVVTLARESAGSTTLEVGPPIRRRMDALVLKGGGVKGLALAGALVELQRWHTFDAYVGTSAGAIAAALLAVGYDGKELERILREKDFRDFLDGRWWAHPWNLLVKRGLHSGLPIQNWLRELFRAKLIKIGETKLSDVKALGKRLVIHAAAKGGLVTFDSHRPGADAELHWAVRCSMSIPIFFQPESIQGHPAFDGGLLNNFPVKTFVDEWEKKHGAPPRFIALYLGAQEDLKRASIWQVFSDLVATVIDRDEAAVVDEYRDSTIVIDPRPIATTDFSLTEDEKELLVLRGRHAALDHLHRLKTPGGPTSSEVLAVSHEMARVEADVTRRRRTRPAIVGLIVSVAILCAVAVLLRVRMGGPVRDPVVLCVHDNKKDGFGLLHAVGLERALAPIKSDVQMRSCDATLEAFKGAEGDELAILFQSVRDQVAQRRPIAIVGPSIAEATPAFLRTIELVAASLPVFIETAASRERLDWNSSRLALFRISSGVNERAVELAGLVKDLCEHDVAVTVLVERREGGEKTYGVELEEAMGARLSKDHLARLNTVYYVPGRIDLRIDSVRAETEQAQVILLLGLGSDLKTVVTNLYTKKSEKVRAPLVALMCGHTLQSELSKAPDEYRADLLFDITDIDVDPGSSEIGQRRELKREFLSTDADVAITPAQRDEAFSFDAGVCVRLAWGSLTPEERAAPYPSMLRVLTQRIFDLRFHGVSSNIHFDTRADQRGQNTETKLSLCQYLPPNWKPAGRSLLFVKK